MNLIISLSWLLSVSVLMNCKTIVEYADGSSAHGTDDIPLFDSSYYENENRIQFDGSGSYGGSGSIFIWDEESDDFEEVGSKNRIHFGDSDFYESGSITMWDEENEDFEEERSKNRIQFDGSGSYGTGSITMRDDEETGDFEESGSGHKELNKLGIYQELDSENLNEKYNSINIKGVDGEDILENIVKEKKEEILHLKNDFMATPKSNEITAKQEEIKERFKSSTQSNNLVFFIDKGILIPSLLLLLILLCVTSIKKKKDVIYISSGYAMGNVNKKVKYAWSREHNKISSDEEEIIDTVLRQKSIKQVGDLKKCEQGYTFWPDA